MDNGHRLISFINQVLYVCMCAWSGHTILGSHKPWLPYIGLLPVTFSHKQDQGDSRPSTKLQFAPAATWPCTSKCTSAPGIDRKRTPAPGTWNWLQARAGTWNWSHQFRLAPGGVPWCRNLDFIALIRSAAEFPGATTLVTVITSVKIAGDCDGGAPGSSSLRGY